MLIGAVAAYLQFTQQQQATRDQLQASHDLLISNQVSRGFEQLAGKETAMRLGGIYALEGVMNTSEQYHQPVIEALCAFVRESTKPSQVTLTAWLEALFFGANERTAGKVNDTPATDVQAALTVIGRRKGGLGEVNLVGANIPGADLFEAHLERANLAFAHLEGAYLAFANLKGAKFGEAHLQRAHLSRAHLERAPFYKADLDHADLTGAYLDDANLTGAHLDGASLSDADLSGADLGDVDLSGALGLNQAQLNQACGKPKLPPGLALDKSCPPERPPSAVGVNRLNPPDLP